MRLSEVEEARAVNAGILQLLPRLQAVLAAGPHARQAVLLPAGAVVGLCEKGMLGEQLGWQVKVMIRKELVLPAKRLARLAIQAGGTIPPKELQTFCVEAARQVISVRQITKPVSPAYYEKREVEMALRAGLEPRHIADTILRRRMAVDNSYMRMAYVSPKTEGISKLVGIAPGRWMVPYLDPRARTMTSRRPFKYRGKRVDNDYAIPLLQLAEILAPFHPDRINDVLGMHLATMVEWVGWDNPERDVLAVGLRHSVFVQEMHFMKADLVRRLQGVVELKHAHGVRLYLGLQRVGYQQMTPGRRRLSLAKPKPPKTPQSSP